MSQAPLQARPRPVSQQRPMLILHLAMVGLFLLDLALPRNILLLPYYFLLVVLSASFATPRRMLPLIVQSYGLAIASGIYWGFFPSIDYLTRLLALSGVAAVAVHLAAQRSREVALRHRSEDVLKTTIDNSGAGVALTDPSGRFFLTNPAFCEILGRDPETIPTLLWQDITHPDDLPHELALVQEILANRRSSYRIKVRNVRGDGRTIWIDLSVSCSRRSSGDVEYLIGQFIDITAQVEAEQALARSEKLVRQTLEQTHLGLALCAPATGHFLLTNQELRSELGADAEALQASTLGEVLQTLSGRPDASSGEGQAPEGGLDHAAVAAVLRGERDSYRVRLQLHRRQPSSGWGDLRISNLRDDAGAPTHVLVELADVSEIVAKSDFLEAAAAAGVVGVWDWDPVHDVLTYDPVMYKLYGCKPDQFSGAYEAWAAAVHPEDRPYAEAAIQAALRGEREYAPRFRVVWPDGSVHHLQAASKTSFDDQGRAVRMLGVNYDITDLVNTQEKLAVEQQRLRATLDSLLDPHVLFQPVRDPEGQITDLRILRANPAAAAYNNMPMEAFVGATLRQILPEVVEKGLFDLYRQVLVSCEPLLLDDYEYRQHELLGGSRHYDIRAVKVGDELSVTWRDVSDRIAMKKALEQRAATDSLTTLLNREEAFSQIERLLGRDQRRGRELAVLFCDLDRFKDVNDTYGHQAGDAVLQSMAERVRAGLRTSDLAARIGGDELLVALPGVQGLEDALGIAEKLRSLASEPVPIPQGQVEITLSVGVALASPGESLDALVARADAAMYEAKQRGRNRVVAIPRSGGPTLGGTQTQ
ncbi:MAG: diguanylate cyclase [Cyanobacteriota bacterium]|nr:diguanylate cyclase [Cyanobacteriota bacterium]